MTFPQYWQCLRDILFIRHSRNIGEAPFKSVKLPLYEGQPRGEQLQNGVERGAEDEIKMISADDLFASHYAADAHLVEPEEERQNPRGFACRHQGEKKMQSFARHPYVVRITWAEPCRNRRQKACALRQCPGNILYEWCER